MRLAFCVAAMDTREHVAASRMPASSGVLTPVKTAVERRMDYERGVPILEEN
jgi:hypothetical protein